MRGMWRAEAHIMLLFRIENRVGRASGRHRKPATFRIVQTACAQHDARPLTTGGRTECHAGLSSQSGARADRTSSRSICAIAAPICSSPKSPCSARRPRRANALPVHIDAWVVLPEHMHCIRTLPGGDADFPVRWQAIKAAFSRSVPPSEEDRREPLIRRPEAGIWQRRYWEHTIRDERDFAAHLDCIHFNPVKHGLADSPADWPFSSFR